MNESIKRILIIVTSAILAVLLFFLTVVYGISMLFSPESITDIVVQADYGSLLGESISIEDTAFTETGTAEISSGSIGSFLQRENVSGVLSDVLQTYNDALIDGNLDYYLTPDELSSILRSVSSDIQSEFGITLADDFDVTGEIPEEFFKQFSIGSLSEQAKISPAVPYTLFSVKTQIIILLLCFSAAANIIIVNKSRITRGLKFAGIPVLLSGALFAGIGLILKINPGMGSLSEIVNHLGGMSPIILRCGIIYLITGIAAIAASLVTGLLRRKRRDVQEAEKPASAGTKRIWLICTLAVNIIIPALCILNVYQLVRDVPQVRERPYFIEINNTSYSTSKTVLNLPSMNLTNEQIEPLKHMLDLTELNLEDNQISDISALTDLTEITVLSLSNNQITDISALKNMNKVTELSLSNNRITDISPLADMDKMTELSLSNNQITDVSPLRGMSEMTVLYLDNNKVKSISALSGMTEIETLTLNDNQLTDISSLSSMKKLTEIPVNNNLIEDLSSLAGLTGLVKLDLSNNQIADISPLSGLDKLIVLYLDNNRISDLSALSKLYKLAVLSLNDNRIDNMTPINQLYYLTELYADNNQILDLYPLKRMMNLRVLSLNNNDIRLFLHLDYLGEELKELRLADNQISGSIDDVKFLKNLEILDLSGNKIDDISGLIIDEDGEGAVSLKEIDLSGNPITDWSPAERIPAVHGRP